MFDRATRPGRTRIGTACRKPCGMKGAHRVPCWCLEADRATVCRPRLRTVQRAQDQEFSHFPAIADPLIEELTHVPDTQRCQGRVVERFGTGNIVAAKADLREDAYATRSS